MTMSAREISNISNIHLQAFIYSLFIIIKVM